MRFGGSLLLLLLFALACTPELAPGPDEEPAPDYLGGMSATRPSASSEQRSREPPQAEVEAGATTQGAFQEVLLQASRAKVRCPAAAAWVDRLEVDARTDGWGRLLVAECGSGDLVLRSLGRDGIRGNDDMKLSMADFKEPIVDHFRERPRLPSF